MASSHFAESGLTIASAYVAGSSLLSNNTSRTLCNLSDLRGSCRGVVTADVLELGLSRGAIATRKLEGVNTGQGTRGFILVRPLTVKVKAYVQLRWY